MGRLCISAGVVQTTLGILLLLSVVAEAQGGICGHKLKVEPERPSKDREKSPHMLRVGKPVRLALDPDPYSSDTEQSPHPDTPFPTKPPGPLNVVTSEHDSGQVDVPDKPHAKQGGFFEKSTEAHLFSESDSDLSQVSESSGEYPFDETTCKFDAEPPTVNVKVNTMVPNTASSEKQRWRGVYSLMRGYAKGGIDHFPSKIVIHCTRKVNNRLNSRAKRDMERALATITGKRKSKSMRNKTLGKTFSFIDPKIEFISNDKHDMKKLFKVLVPGWTDPAKKILLLTDNPEAVYIFMQENEKAKEIYKDSSLVADVGVAVSFYKTVIDKEQVRKGLNLYRSFFGNVHQDGFEGGFNYSKAKRWVAEAKKEQKTIGVGKIDLGILLNTIVSVTTNYSFGKFGTALFKISRLFGQLLSVEPGTKFVQLNNPRPDKSNCWLAQLFERMTRETTDEVEGPLFARMREANQGFIEDKQLVLTKGKGIKHYLILDDNTCTGEQMTKYIEGVFSSPVMKSIPDHVITVGIMFGTRRGTLAILERFEEICGVPDLYTQDDISEKHSADSGLDIVMEAICGGEKGGSGSSTLRIFVYRETTPISDFFPEDEREAAVGTLDQYHLHRSGRGSQVSLRFDWKVVDFWSMPTPIMVGAIPNRDEESDLWWKPHPNRWIEPACPPYKMPRARTYLSKLLADQKIKDRFDDELKLEVYCDSLEENLYGKSFFAENMIIENNGPRNPPLIFYKKIGDNPKKTCEEHPDSNPNAYFFPNQNMQMVGDCNESEVVWSLDMVTETLREPTLSRRSRSKREKRISRYDVPLRVDDDETLPAVQAEDGTTSPLKSKNPYATTPKSLGAIQDKSTIDDDNPVDSSHSEDTGSEFAVYPTIQPDYSGDSSSSLSGTWV